MKPPRFPSASSSAESGTRQRQEFRVPSSEDLLSHEQVSRGHQRNLGKKSRQTENPHRNRTSRRLRKCPLPDLSRSWTRHRTSRFLRGMPKNLLKRESRTVLDMLQPPG